MHVKVLDYKDEYMFGPINDVSVQEGAVLRFKHSYSLINTNLVSWAIVQKKQDH